MAKIQTFTGEVFYKVSQGAVTSLSWNEVDDSFKNNSKVSEELESYFKGELKNFSLLIKPEGTQFQKKVWEALLEIPYGEIVTYKEIASKLGSHPRAVGGAVGKNPIPIIIPCHRVIGSNGSLTGFSGGDGVSTKKLLLKLEQNNK